jgi:CubicO group peptidase (beta-lactamase class C family)
MCDETSDRVDALFAPWSMGGTPGAAVLVIRYGKIIHKRGYGLADLDKKTPIDPDRTRFRLASVTKQFTAMAILILVERGVLALDDPLSAFFSQFKGEAATITVQQLLWHTSGLPHVEKLFLQTGIITDDQARSSKSRPDEHEPTVRETIDLLARHNKLLFPPGSKEEYSNSGYVVLAAIIEEATGTRYAEFLEEVIFCPAGMERSLVQDERRQEVPHRAASYSWSHGKFGDIDYNPLNWLYGCDNVYTTAADMARWDEALGADRLVAPSTLDQAFTRGHLNDGTRTDTGYGWFLGAHSVWHGGGWLGYRTYIRRYLNRPFTVVVLANCRETNVSCLAEDVINLYLP